MNTETEAHTGQSNWTKVRRGIIKKHGNLKVTEYLNDLPVSTVSCGCVEYAPHSSTGDQAASHSGIEFLILIEGEIIVDVDGKSYRLAAGDSIEFDAQLPHRGRNPNEGIAKAVYLYLYPS